MALYDDVRLACRLTTTAYDTELAGLVGAALKDLGITDIDPSLLESTEALDPLVKQAVITYCKANFGFQSADYHDHLMASYNETKAEMLMSSGYMTWGDADA